jgi:hypothetical protein
MPSSIPAEHEDEQSVEAARDQQADGSAQDERNQQD